jgi:peptide/nickel transport system permease protein
MEITYTSPFAVAIHTMPSVMTLINSALPTFIITWLVSLAGILLFVTQGSRRRFKAIANQVKKPQKNRICAREFLFAWTLMLLVCFVLYYLSRYYHIMGTDKIGQDVFYQAVKSIRTGVLIGTLTTMVMLPFALFMGTLAGYFRGFVDDVIQYIYTTLSSIPGVLLIAASVLILEVFIAHHPEWFTTTAERADARLFALCVILGITSWTSLCRLIRAETLKIRELDYVLAAKTLKVSHFGIILRHILPNLMHIIIITIVLDFSGLVLAEAVLSYIGVGVDPSMQSFGNMINSARLELAREPLVWWPLAAAFILMFLLVLSANLFADTVRDAFNPRVIR